jgi:hypothetical protein
MEFRFNIENPSSAEKFQKILELLISAYNTSSKLFDKIYQENLSTNFKKELYKLSLTNRFAGTDLEDLRDMASEVYYYYKPNCYQYKDITLRDSDELNEFEVFMDLLTELYMKSDYHFFLNFPHCPTIYWDKVDDLREHSIKTKRDSDQYIKCLEKAKFLAYTYEDLFSKYHNFKKNIENEI